NLKLSGERAENVCKYLIQKGISSDRLRTVGKGDTQPIADNSSIHGRKLNSRIEIHRID
ncbi:MAG: OmpA family protein, partial [Fibrobacter sp.]|nr:OmpA family protein [Fibrobacter sp.]